MKHIEDEILLHNEVYNQIVKLSDEDSKSVLLNLITEERARLSKERATQLDEYLDQIHQVSYHYNPHAAINSLVKVLNSSSSTMTQFVKSLQRIQDT